MTQYRIRSSEDGSSVDMFTVNGWVEVIAFTNANHRENAAAWISHSEYLDRLDNA